MFYLLRRYSLPTSFRVLRPGVLTPFTFPEPYGASAGGHLYIDIPEGDRSELFAESPTQFFLKIRPRTLTFVKDGARVIRLDILDRGEVVSAPKVD